MENISEFDLNTALRLWLERLSQSPQFRSENLQELESHVRDSVGVLLSKGLSAEEAFLIGIRRVGSSAALEPEFARENGGRGWHHGFRRMVFKYGNKAAHALVLIFFSVGCWFLWAMTRVPYMMAGASARRGRLLPAFSRLVIDCGPWLVVPALVALIYCAYVWTRKSNRRSSWAAFFAVAIAVLILLAIPIVIAAFLPLIDFINNLPAQALQP